MKTTVMTMVLVSCIAILVLGCAEKYKKVTQEMKQPINCATAEGDIRMLEREKADTLDKMAEGVSAVVPVSMVVGVAAGTEGTKMKVATGDYNKMIDQRIKEIKEHCGIE